MAAAVDDEAWLQAMLDVEAALARAEARVGLIPESAAAAIQECCRADRFDIERLGEEAAAAASPVVPLVRHLVAIAPPEAAEYVHLGATSQDVIDTAMMLVARRALDIIAADLDGLADACAGLAARHRQTLMAARTLLQQALPITFGLKAAGWLQGVDDAAEGLRAWRERRLAVQLGGAAGSLAAFGDQGLVVVAGLASELDLPEPPVSWHTARGRVAELGAALAVTAGAAGKIALDVALLSQTEVAEVVEPAPGGSSTLPQKRNPVASVEVAAAHRGVTAQAGLLLGGLAQEHERAAGALQAEWPSLSEALRLTGGAVSRTRTMLEGLAVDGARMRANLELSGPPLMAESVATALTPALGRQKAQQLVREAAGRAGKDGSGFEAALMGQPEVREVLGTSGMEAALDPRAYLGSTQALIDRALAAHEVAKAKEGR